ncbi:MAG: hypothetical protein H6825_13485 [Planctomycetes bacterium]|nr:hypothetical protein [Planctomycetota bacterium]
MAFATILISLVLLVGDGSSSGAGGAALSDDGFRPLRPAVLGLRVERDATGDLHRLVRESGEVLVTGDVDACEQALVDDLRARFGTGHGNLALPTFGGLQFWGDHFVHAGWRIQENALTGHARLLDPDGVRRAWGTPEQCRTAFEALRLERHPAWDGQRLVLLVHGLGRTHHALAALGDALVARGDAVQSLAYPSLRATIAGHGAQLHDVLASLEGVAEVSFVTHSLGGIVVRDALARDRSWTDRVALGRVVMLAPPNHGAEIARRLDEWLPLGLLMGPSALQLAHDSLDELPAPPCEFGIVAATRGAGRGWNPLLPGEDDGLVTVEETRLAGAADTLVVDGLHTVLMNDPRVIEAVLRFLDHGSFGEAGSGSDPGSGSGSGSAADAPDPGSDSSPDPGSVAGPPDGR